MLDMGWAEIGVLFVLALLIFGPDKLPKLASDAAGMIRKLRELAQNAQSGLTDQGIDVDGIKSDLQSVADLHPKRIVGSVVNDFKTASSAAMTTATSDSPKGSSDVPTSGAHTESGAAGEGTTPLPESGSSESPSTTVTPTANSTSEPVKIVQSSTKIDPDAT